MLRLGLCAAALLCVCQPGAVRADCWLIEGDKGYVWLAICSQNQPPYETIPQHINSTVHDLRLNENKLKAVLYSSLNRFGNLTDLNLTKNEISYIEDGAFLGQTSLQVLQLGYNRLSNLTEGMLRGMSRLQFLFVQHNLIEVVTPTAFSECPSLISIDLSSNRLSRLDGATFASLASLMVCELAGNPFNCECDLFGFLAWLVVFNNVTKNYDRLQCESPREFAGYPLLVPRPYHSLNAITVLQAKCRNGSMPARPVSHPTPYSTDAQREPDENSGFNPDEILSVEPPASSTTDASAGPAIKLHQVTFTSATLVVIIPHPYSKMYVLVQYNNSYFSDVMTLKNKKEIVTLDKLRAHTEYTFCVTSLRNSRRFNHTCLTFTTRDLVPGDLAPSTSTTTHYIMTILGCLFGMVIVLGAVYYCLRKRRMQEEKQKSVNVKKTILEMRYGADVDAGSIVHAAQKLGEPPVLPVARMSSIPSMVGEKLPASKGLEAGLDTPKVATKGNYIEVRTGAAGDSLARPEEELPEIENGQGSAAEISTIAKEVDKVNQIINNCIDALKLDSASFLGGGGGGGGGGDSDLAFECQSLPAAPAASSAATPGALERPSFLSPPYKESSHHPLQRQLSADAAVSRKTCSVSSSGSIKSAKVFSLDVPDHPTPTGLAKSDSKYIEKGSPLNSPLDRLPLVPTGSSGSSGGGGGIHHLEVKPAYHCSEHRHSFPALYYEEGADSLSQRVSFLKPLTRSKRDSTYSQLSPRHYYSGYSSSPEYSSESTHKIWERFRPYKKHHREEVYMAAGHALRKKVQFAKDEDLHDILDYWKGVSAQQKL
ncbi:protein phosphatase 1 regulatory subunit 29 isoform X1 [Mus musculus]|jgi:protein phosphatase 1 regulatory subunit 29|uniref:Protein phosphatase 1 regulatory subunit 29 n=2 Tax=Mus TaxID=862507 RepID=PPR29_MOUSE|nr:protein phosphatase 1 regulatory subunit 29 precursor [Mus musculus]NP_001403338.1 protein phosphatase 1 regulatory subunit 29 precursor [Mus musculus]NP_898964.2 protein phosphatase 1 regulatory subunit 29 precursor [Mus musculus]XP_036015183.1 protein phosphatase 1 regulatory subunit 29 isoform X1 [Mus musculus]XP_036015185.1 protein phosphatase 1 regulatory subunit 29 isoform X1 [Mus musculus]Q68FM6.1 RecName: Full=Protein phosphatase 1 regulatory subunit 29; AltName: Full=Extracellular |eukprot:NP_898964.2 protein phosphatase 1 regulatory subunit 29 precursor [Mus musculus]